MYKIDPFALFTANAWRKKDVEDIECDGKIWINQTHLKKNLVLQILLTELSITLTNFKKRDAKYKSVANINLVKCLLKILRQYK